MFKFSEPLEESYSILKFTDSQPLVPGSFEVMDIIDSGSIDGENFVRTQVDIYGLTESTIFLAVASDDIPTIWPEAEDGVTTTQKATIFEVEGAYEKSLGLYAQLFDISPATPFLPASGWNNGPEKHDHKYSFRKTFTRVLKPSGEDGVVWQDFSDSKIYVTWFSDSGHETIKLPNPGDNTLVAAAGDGGLNGEIIYMTVSILLLTLILLFDNLSQQFFVFVFHKFGKEANDDKVSPLDVKGIKVDMDGNQIKNKTMDATKSEGGLNVWKFFKAGSSLVWDTTSNTLGWTVSRTMLRGNDGVNHQGCKVVILGADDFEILIIKTTSSHSLNNDIQIYNSSETSAEYLAVDLGDGAPRGVHVHKIDPIQRTKKVRMKINPNNWPIFVSIKLL